MAIFLSHTDVQKLIRMEDILTVVEQAVRGHGTGETVNLARQRLRVPRGVYRVMSGGVPGLGAMGTKVGLHYFKVPPGTEKAHDVNVLYNSETGELLAVLWTNLIGNYRTGAVSGVATKYLARPDAAVVGVLGSGTQARTQLLAVALARRIRKVLVYSPDAEHRRAYCEEMESRLNLPVTPVGEARSAVEEAEILIAATDSFAPVFHGGWLREGVHVNSIRSSHRIDIAQGKERREIDDLTVRRSAVIAVDCREQAELQDSPELMNEIRQGKVCELGEIVAGSRPGRGDSRGITLFKSFGTGFADVAASMKVYERAVEAGIGTPLSWP